MKGNISASLPSVCICLTPRLDHHSADTFRPLPFEMWCYWKFHSSQISETFRRLLKVWSVVGRHWVTSFVFSLNGERTCWSENTVHSLSGCKSHPAAPTNIQAVAVSAPTASEWLFFFSTAAESFFSFLQFLSNKCNLDQTHEVQITRGISFTCAGCCFFSYCLFCRLVCSPHV